MKKLIVLLRNSLELVLRLGVEKWGIVKYATSDNFLLSGSKGRIGDYVFYVRMGEQVIRRRQGQFKIKDPDYWKGRIDRFKACINLSRSLKFDLKNLYESNPKAKTYYNLLVSQLMKFWAGGPAPAPYTFTPGTVEVEIGNGRMPEAREVSYTASEGGHLIFKWDTDSLDIRENADDILQVMLIASDGSFGMFLAECGDPDSVIRRKDGDTGFDWIVPPLFLTTKTSEVFCAIKFKSGTGAQLKANGNFIFPEGVKPIALIP